MDLGKARRALVAAHQAGDTSSAQRIAAAIREQEQGNALRTTTAPPIPDLAMPAAREAPGFSERFLHGAVDPIVGGAQLLNRAIPQSFDPYGERLSPEGYDRMLQAREGAYQAERGPDAGIDWARMGGNIAATAPLAAMAPATIPGAAMAGAGTAALMPAERPGNFWTQKALQTGVGGAGGAAGGAVAKLVGRLISPSDDVLALTREGVQPTPGQSLGGWFGRIEESAMSAPVAGHAIRSARDRAATQFNKAAYNRALAPLGKRFQGEVGHEGVAQVRKTIGNEYEKLMPDLVFKADQPFADDLQVVLNRATEDLPETMARRLVKTVNDKLLDRMDIDTISGAKLKGIESELSRLGRKFTGSNSADDRLYGEALDDVLTAVRSSLERNNPAAREQLRALNTGWANFVRIRDAASRPGNVDGVFSPAQLQQAVRAQDKSVGKGAFGEGRALLQDLSRPGKNVLSQKVPDSGTPERALAAAALEGSLAKEVALAAPLAWTAYSRPGQALLSGALTRRPQAALPIREAFDPLTAYFGITGASGTLEGLK